jgi:hypothetical protein
MDLRHEPENRDGTFETFSGSQASNAENDIRITEPFEM